MPVSRAHKGFNIEMGRCELGTLNGRPVPLLPSTLSSQEAFLDFSPENLEHPQKLRGNKLRPANLTEPTWAREESGLRLNAP